MGLKVGDRVKILDVRGIDLASYYKFNDGDTVNIVRVRGNRGLGLETNLISGDVGLYLSEDEYKYVEKV